MISPKHVFAMATTALTGAVLAASFQTPLFASDGPQRYHGPRYDKPIAGYEIVETTVTLRPNAFAGGDAICPAGKKVLGGGFSWASRGRGDEPVVTFNQAIGGGSQWRVVFRNPALSEVTSATVTAQCAFAR
ncbi:hypothetical protein AB0L44_41045 [Nonomuraea wenchangensis]|uniref:hypothetical protein n=1 Tax=Nonomuraea wenchangensis TaxID=568860 RepID=UPI00341B0AD7